MVGSPPSSPRPLLARLTAPPGPARFRVVTVGETTVVAVPGRYSVTYLLVSGANIAVVDIGSLSDHPGILRTLDWLGYSPRQVQAVIPTHLHMDHIIGIDDFACRFNIPVTLGSVAYEAVTRGRRLRFPRGVHTLRAVPTYVMQGAPRSPLADWKRGLGFGFPWSKNKFRADLAPPLADGAALPGLAGWRVLHTPGHADDAICLHHASARLLVAGDTARNFLGGEWNQLVCCVDDFERTKRRLRLLEVDTIFPGHGPLIEGTRTVDRLRSLPRYLP